MIPDQSPEAIGAAAATDAWAGKGRSLLLRARPYHEALNVLAGRYDEGPDLATARQAFDRTLARLAASSSTIIRPKLPQSRRRR